MNDMVERGARAFAGPLWEGAPETQADADKLFAEGDWPRMSREAFRREARAALLAALDPSDEKLVEAMARDACNRESGSAYTWDGGTLSIELREYWREEASAALSSLRAAIQSGEDK